MIATSFLASLTSGRLREHAASILKAERVLLICILLGAFLTFLRCVPLVLSPYQIDYGEGLMLEGALRIRHAQPLYPNPFGFPVVLHVYGPVAYTATAAVLPAGASPFPAGRVLILICSTVLALLVARILRSLTGSWRIGLSFGFLLLTLPAFRFWVYLLRADVMGVVLSLAGVSLYLCRGNRWYWCIPFFTLALFCKYSLLAAPVAVFVHLILKRGVRPGLAYAGTLAGTCALAFLAIQEKTGGWFAFHMFSTHPDRYALTQYFALAAVVAASAPLVTALALWQLATDVHSRAWTFPPIYLVTSTVSALTAGKLGSTTNHFIEWMVACCLCAGIGYSRLKTKYPSRAMPITVLLSASVLVGVVVQNRSSLQPMRELAECGGVYQYVRNSTSSRILSENLGPLLLARKPILISDPFVYGQFVRHGRWPDRQIEELINQRYFDLIVMSKAPSEARVQDSDVWPESLVSAVERHYRPVSRFACRNAGVVLQPIAQP